MKHYLLFVLLSILSFTALAYDEKFPTTDTHFRNIKAFGYYGSGRLPVGYQFFMGLESVGKYRTELGVQLINQFSSGANHDLSGTVFRKKNLFNTSEFSDLLTYNVRIRKLQFTENPQVNLNQRAWYTLTFNNKYSIGAGAELMDGTTDAYGLLLTAGKYFPSQHLCINTCCSFIAGSIDYKTSISKTVSLGKTNLTTCGIELAVENFQGYKDVSLGILVYF